jgi:hypothetical protein
MCVEGGTSSTTNIDFFWKELYYVNLKSKEKSLMD